MKSITSLHEREHQHRKIYEWVLAAISGTMSLMWWVTTDFFSARIWLLVAMFVYGIWLTSFLFYHRKHLNRADAISSLRVGCCFGLLGYFLQEDQAASSWTLAAIALLIIAADGLDGWLARRLPRQSQHGPDLDMQCDHIITSILVGYSVLHIGVMEIFLAVNLLRPLYLAAQFLKAPKSERQLWPWQAKTICVVSMLILCLNLSPLANLQIKSQFSGLALFLLSYSFLFDFISSQYGPRSQRVIDRQS